MRGLYFLLFLALVTVVMIQLDKQPKVTATACPEPPVICPICPPCGGGTPLPTPPRPQPGPIPYEPIPR